MTRSTAASLLFLLAATGCEQEFGYIDLAGEDGVLRFNLEFTNEANVDLDLHVVAPDGSHIYYAEKEGAGGRLDVDCFCGEGNCDNGPNENIFWDYSGEAPPGTYEVRVEYYGICDVAVEPSEYTLRIMQSGRVVDEFLGALGYLETVSYTHVEAARE